MWCLQLCSDSIVFGRSSQELEPLQVVSLHPKFNGKIPQKELEVDLSRDVTKDVATARTEKI